MVGVWAGFYRKRSAPMTATAAAAAKVAANPPWSSSHAVSVARHAIRKITASSMVRGVIFGPILLGLTPHGGRRRVLELSQSGEWPERRAFQLLGALGANGS